MNCSYLYFFLELEGHAIASVDSSVVREVTVFVADVESETCSLCMVRIFTSYIAV